MDAHPCEGALLMEDPIALPVRDADTVMLLRLLQLADSALPVGGFTHSYGFESLVEYGYLQPERLEPLLRDWLQESGALEAYHCAATCRLARAPTLDLDRWIRINLDLGARKQARESREASCAIGRRLLHLAARALGLPRLPFPSEGETHYACCFGLVAGALALPESLATPAFLHQAVTGLVSAFQRLMPVGHTWAQEVLFRLKPEIALVSERAIQAEEPAASFAFLPELGSMRHPRLPVRLFMS